MNKMSRRMNDEWDKEKLAEFCKLDRWLEPDEALAMGLIDEIINEK